MIFFCFNCFAVFCNVARVEVIFTGIRRKEGKIRAVHAIAPLQIKPVNVWKCNAYPSNMEDNEPTVFISSSLDSLGYYGH